ncbi:hypothetical protein Vretimale_4348 [Volvox reticuliferus]|uniref:Uncharacterized protein n=1 Tax=Volvox reticuliferus TaxID=1737510 RepID=A0A8J4DAR7_9CHLO|nr:hypothetical protein Vretimale_4348 [Volvox reticuliferus]
MEAAVLPMSPLQASGGSGGSGVPALSPEVASALAAAVLRSREINTGCEERAGASAPAALRQRRHSIVRTGWLGWWPLALAEKALVVGAASAVSVASELLEGVSHLQPPAPYGPEEGLITVPLLRPYATLWAHLPWPIAPVAHTGWWMLVGLTCGMLAAVDTMRGLLGLPGLIPIP